MGLYCIQLKPGATEKIPATMISLAMPVIRVELRDNGTYYFYKDPRRPRKEFAFWTYSDGNREFWSSGLSSSSTKIAEGFSAAGLFGDDSA